MYRPLSVPFPLLHPTDDDDDDDCAPSSSNSNPHTSFLLLLDPAHSDEDDEDETDLCRRSRSLASVDSGYFSITGRDSPTKSSRQMPSRIDPRPLIPIDGTPYLTQESPKREGVIKNLSFLRKKKRSKSTTSPSSPDLDLHVIGRVPVDSPARRIRPAPSSPPSSPSSLRNSYVEPFERQDRFIVRRGMKHHPYSRDDAPYMRAYDRTLLDIDKFSEILLRRLNHNQSPSFHNFSHGAPKTILDLGCGPGYWALEAAEFWPSSQVIGFDLLDPARLRHGVETPNNVQWRQGNFVRYKLPFPKNMFDFVRMANLSLCIPRERWEHVLSEARRVLAQGGHLELIDDYLYFPYTRHPPQPQPSADSRGSPLSSSFDDRGGSRLGGDVDVEQKDGDDDDDDSDDDNDFVSTKSRFSSFVDSESEFLPEPEVTYDPVAEWNRSVNESRSLEKIFEDMLLRKFSIDPWPSKFFDNVIDRVFGRYNQCRLHEFNLYLAPPSTHDSDCSSIGSSESQVSAGPRKPSKDLARWVTIGERDLLKEKVKKQRTNGDRSSEESSTNLSVVPDTVSTKATGRLGTQPTPPHSISSQSHPTQSPGLILWPATFIPIPPLELEMHACKHLHSLIGCKAGLIEFIQDIAREKQLPFDEQMVEDVIWEYECFRRKRFNWPSECPGSDIDTSIPITTTPRSNTFRSPPGSMSAPPDPLFPREKLDFLRSIKVYSATKIDEEIHVV